MLLVLTQSIVRLSKWSIACWSCSSASDVEEQEEETEHNLFRGLFLLDDLAISWVDDKVTLTGLFNEICFIGWLTDCDDITEEGTWVLLI